MGAELLRAEERATAIHESGYNCAQSVLAAFQEKTGLDDKTAFAISGGLGGGARCGEICGAVSSAILVLGLVYPFYDASDLDAKERIAQKTRELTQTFEKKFGALRCDDLKNSGCSCPELICFAAQLAEQMIQDNTMEKEKSDGNL